MTDFSEIDCFRALCHVCAPRAMFPCSENVLRIGSELSPDAQA